MQELYLINRDRLTKLYVCVPYDEIQSFYLIIVLILRTGITLHVYVHEHFSNSLIIHDVKTKKIRGMKKVWIPGLN